MDSYDATAPEDISPSDSYQLPVAKGASGITKLPNKTRVYAKKRVVDFSTKNN
jgi:hypothetical protein